MINPTKPSPQHANVRMNSTQYEEKGYSQREGQTSLQATASRWQPSAYSSFTPSSNGTQMEPFRREMYTYGSDFGSFRYIDVRVAIPADAPPDFIDGYVQSSLSFETRKENCETGPQYSWDATTRHAAYQYQNRSSSGSAESSFVPINLPGTYRKRTTPNFDTKHRGNPFPPMDYDRSATMHAYGKASPSPSLMTLETAEMTETSFMSCYSSPASSRMSSPTACIPIPPHNLQNHRQTMSSNFHFSDSYRSVTPTFGIDHATRPNEFPSARISNKTINTISERLSPSPMFGRKSPTKLCTSHANGEEDEVRKCKVKTELCMHYMNGNACPFGTNCTYAHGEEELQMTKLIDLHEAGLVDMNTFRIKPCLTWVATGSCPFGRRCTCIHDPRISGSHPSWLPHTETQGNTISTDINVDALHQKRLNTILFNNPFGIEQLAPSLHGNDGKCDRVSTQWETLYNLICDSNQKLDTEGCKLGTKQINKNEKMQLNPLIKLQIALKLRDDSNSDWQYKYRPQHSVKGELCMILSKRAFRVVLQDSKPKKKAQNVRGNQSHHDSVVVEIPLTKYNSELSNHIIVREIAFGPDGDSTVRGVALWFNVEDEDVIECTSQQAKRFRWKKGIKTNKNEADGHVTKNGIKKSIFDSPSTFDSFPMIRPCDKSAYDLATDIIKHRIAVLKVERTATGNERFDAVSLLELEKSGLENRFRILQRDWLVWGWPVSNGRDCIDRNTPVPAVDGHYHVNETKTEQDSNEHKTNAVGKDSSIKHFGSNVERIWYSFIAATCQDFNANEEHSSKGPSSTDILSLMKHRLPIFQRLSSGPSGVCKNVALPHICTKYLKPTTDERGIGSCSQSSELAIQQERCWKALLLKPSEENGATFHENDESESKCLKTEWDIVRDHFENSRSKKVLTIIQQ